MEPIRAVQWSPGGDAVRIIDQRRLPGEFIERDLRSLHDVCDAIATLAVRGAPAIGVAAAMGLVTSLQDFRSDDRHAFAIMLESHARALAAMRPTAVNLAWAIGRMRQRAAATKAAPQNVLAALRVEATAILDEDRAMCEAIGRHGQRFLPSGARVLTHCNAGALATAGIGTALAPVYVAHAAGRSVSVLAGETRPLLQGARLTAWELSRAGIPVQVITDGMGASAMQNGAVDVVIVGADRIAANGDVANKIGTYSLAVAAHHHNIPFVVCAPSSTIDPRTANGGGIVVEMRHEAEVRSLAGVPVAAHGAGIWNPAFDITPAALITAIVTDHGVRLPPYSFTS
ncbi:MAG: S-methyl-5-thioribose-1-phosphate isomerase [Gemmatimonadetes bacterium]|nr:S-methyl-5-thioribose-1-phosphate isomerase [Gemmatimonadota bacterium]